MRPIVASRSKSTGSTWAHATFTRSRMCLVSRSQLRGRKRSLSGDVADHVPVLFAEGQRDGLRAAVHVELGQDPLNVRRNRFWADHEPASDLVLLAALGEEVQDLVLALRETGELPIRGGGPTVGTVPLHQASDARNQLARVDGL